jgi:predicted Kef-type K+ transport protein
MDLIKEKRALPQRYLRFSKEMVGLSLVLLAVAYGLIVSSWRLGPVVGGVCGGLALGVFFTAGYYWGCENESCS